MTPILGFLLGLGLLVFGAEALVRGASRLAAAIGMSSLAIGLTVVAFGTSAPELAVSLKASLAGQTDVSLGNVIGSNTFNVLAILGLAALITPLRVHSLLVRRDIPVMIGVSLLAWLLAADGVIGRADAAGLIVVFLGYSVWLFRSSAAPGDGDEPAAAGARGSLLAAGGAVAVGLAALVVGARLLVDAAVQMATAAGVDEVVIGLTIVAAGTSLPEVVTSVVASLRGERDIAVGNIVGSNLFNLLCVLGAAGLSAPEGVPAASAVLRFDFPVMVVAAVVCLPLAWTRGTIDRWEGALLLAGYLVYVGLLVSWAT
ncbi:Inner membrane protein YrbG [Posidoniimonas polymericola]|uniref:Inner membrane protein YrbG n=1 Tax=Posidoniimonas polymericola TaxID=2528002 RepID=A0A5C5XS21_9BACT|nr:calcium/sodium antiporter [Posidoniimonas polymericola]TWT65173.1 Inner membrane protein YrbG [Posidoniimonas polymericola]